MSGPVGSRTGVGTRAPGRSRPSAIALDNRRAITDRDQYICLDLYDHKVLTIEQITNLHFDAVRRARRRLLKLVELGVLELRQLLGHSSYAMVKRYATLATDIVAERHRHASPADRLPV
ncbi:MAG: replication-relaxation family protein [Actinomycetota bacterium]